MNTDEFERKYSPNLGEKQEEEWFICVRPIKVFRQVIHFPKEPNSKKTEWRPEGRPSLRIYSSQDGENFSPQSETLLERHYADALNYNEKSNTITLTIQKPLYGFKYVSAGSPRSQRPPAIQFQWWSYASGGLRSWWNKCISRRERSMTS